MSLRTRGGGSETLNQTESDTKLLYCWMLRLRMSEHGPKTRSKRGRSSLTHLSGPRATTVAARSRFISRAISPGERDTDINDTHVLMVCVLLHVSLEHEAVISRRCICSNNQQYTVWVKIILFILCQKSLGSCSMKIFCVINI